VRYEGIFSYYLEENSKQNSCEIRRKQMLAILGIEKTDTENIRARGLKLEAVKHTVVQVPRLPLHHALSLAAHAATAA
jgi:hypothetical protein